MSQSKASVQDQWAKWCKVTDSKQLEWAVSYLVKKGRLPSPNGMSHWHLAQTINALATQNLADAQLLIKEMKAAWSQKKNRDKNNGRKGYSFIMSTGIQSMLGQLAKSSKTSINVALEDMILDVAQFKEQLQNEQRKKIENAEARQARENERLKQDLEQCKYESGIQIQKFEKEIELQYAAIQELAYEKFQTHAIVIEKGLIELMGEQLSNELVETTEESTNSYLAQLKTTIKQETDKFKVLIKSRRLRSNQRSASDLDASSQQSQVQ